MKNETNKKIGAKPNKGTNTEQNGGGMSLQAAAKMIKGNNMAWATLIALLCDYEGAEMIVIYNLILAIVASDANGVREYKKIVCQDDDGIFLMANCMTIRRILGVEDV